jgi:hypothetical protein
MFAPMIANSGNPELQPGKFIASKKPFGRKSPSTNTPR